MPDCAWNAGWQAPQVVDFTSTRIAFERLTHRRYRFGRRVDETIKAKNRTKSKVRSKVEHAIGVIKRVFGFQKVRYRGLAKNLHRLQVSAALANLFMMRRRLLRLQARCA